MHYIRGLIIFGAWRSEKHETRPSCIAGSPAGNGEWNLGARAPIYEKFKKMLFKSFKKMWSKFLHVYIMLILTRVCFHGKIPLCVTYTKMTKCKFLFLWIVKFLFTILIWTFCHFYAGHTQWYFFVKTHTSKYQHNMYMQNFTSHFFETFK
jgi:hypothetical protein